MSTECCSLSHRALRFLRLAVSLAHVVLVIVCGVMFYLAIHYPLLMIGILVGTAIGAAAVGLLWAGKTSKEERHLRLTIRALEAEIARLMVDQAEAAMRNEELHKEIERVKQRYRTVWRLASGASIQ